MAHLSLEETKKRYHEICSETEDDTEERSEALAALFGSVERTFEFFKWFRDNRLPQPRCARKPALPSPKEFISAIQQVDFTRPKTIDHLTEMLSMSYTPYIPIGSLRSVPLRLYPITYMLRNDRATDYNVAPEDQLLPEVMLGLKFDFSSATDTSDQEGAESEKENARSGQRSTNLPPTPPLTPLDSPPRTSPSDGFVFYQLGRLEYYPSTTADLEQEELISEDWVDSGFVVVIQVLSNGMKGGIYLIHNHNKICDCGDRHNKSGDTLGGVLPTKYDFLSESDSEYDNDEEDELLDTRIYGAFIAAKFEDLVHGKELQVKPFTRKIKEFTRVVKTSNGVYTRQGDKHRAQSTARNSNATSVL